jgi:anti-sigma factor RsiW
MMNRDFSERDIHLALDGELPADERHAFERWLQANPEMKARWTRYEADRARLRETLGPVLQEPLPAALTGTVARPRETPQAGTWWRAAAAAVIFAVGGAAGYAVGQGGWFGPASAPDHLAGQAIAAHLVYAAEKLHVVEVPADQHDHLVGWLSNRLGTKLVAPDFTAEGYSLVGGRLLPAGDRGAAQLMYEDARGDRISLYIARDPTQRKTGFQLRQEDKGCAFYWLDEGYGYVVAGTSSEDTLLALANLAHRQFQATTAGG